MSERVFFLIKPDGLAQEKEILAILDPHFRVVAARRFARTPLRRAAALYAEHRDKPFYPWLMTLFRGRPLKAFILEARPGRGRRDAHRLLEKLVGATNPREAAPGTIRALSDDDIRVSLRQKRTVRNLVHRSRSPKESLREGAIFFYDTPGPAAEGFKPQPFALELVTPFPDAGPGKLKGIFYEERLAGALKSLGLVPPDGRLAGYVETVRHRGAAGRSCRLFLEIAYHSGGRIRRRNLEVL